MDRIMDEIRREEYAEGFVEGFAAGFAEGHTEADRKCALYLLKLGTVSCEEIALCLSLPLDEVRRFESEQSTSS